MSDDTDTNHKEPSLGPACLVLVILTLAVFCAVCGFGSWWVFSDQYPLAEKGISQQLIPWVATSQLGPQDKASITRQLNDLLPLVRERKIDKNQLMRLRNCLQDNPVLLWGGVQSIVEQSKSSELSETEIETVQRVSERLMRMTTDRVLGRNDLEFAIQECSKVREDQTGIEVQSNLTTDQIRVFMKRGEQLANQNNVPNEPYKISPADAFQVLIKAALAPPESMQ